MDFLPYLPSKKNIAKTPDMLEVAITAMSLISKFVRFI